jgi:hypothetical protein
VSAPEVKEVCSVSSCSGRDRTRQPSISAPVFSISLRSLARVEIEASPFERESVLTWSSYRRALRTLFHRVQAGRGEARAAAAA